MRERYKTFVKVFLENLGGEGEGVETAAATAVQQVFSSPGGGMLSSKAAIKRARHLLKRDDISNECAELFEVATGFTRMDFAQKLIQHIEGVVPVDRKHVTKDGEIISYTETLPPSLDALKVYRDMAIPKPPKQVQVDQRTVTMRISPNTPPPALRARVLSLPQGEHADVPGS